MRSGFSSVKAVRPEADSLMTRDEYLTRRWLLADALTNAARRLIDMRQLGGPDSDVRLAEAQQLKIADRLAKLETAQKDKEWEMVAKPETDPDDWEKVEPELEPGDDWVSVHHENPVVPDLDDEIYDMELGMVVRRR
jgi:hypothetical protein